MPHTTLLLDVDGVLQFPRERFADEIEQDYSWITGYAAFRKDLFQDPDYLQTLVGIGDFLAVADTVLPRHVTGLDAKTFLDRWLENNIVVNQHLTELLSTVNVGAMYLASNQEPVRGRHVERLYSDFDWFSGAFFSSTLRARKPDVTYFERLLSAIDTAPEDCVFVDDNAGCVASAILAGIPSIHFTDTDSFIADLQQIG